MGFFKLLRLKNTVQNSGSVKLTQEKPSSPNHSGKDRVGTVTPKSGARCEPRPNCTDSFPSGMTPQVADSASVADHSCGGVASTSSGSTSEPIANAMRYVFRVRFPYHVNLSGE